MTTLAQPRRWLRPGALALALLTTSTLLASCDVAQGARCALLDADGAMRSGDAATRGQAVECVLAKSPERIGPFVPSLLERLTDGAVYKRFWSGGGLIGFGEAGERQVSVAQVALGALRKSRPDERSVTPIVRAMVANANRMGRVDGVGLYGEPGTAAMALAGLLTREYREAGLGALVDAALERELPGIRRAPVRQWIEASLYPVATTAPAAPPPLARDGPHGLTWGLAATARDAAEATFVASCHGEPKAPMDRLHNGSCNPYLGDTACDVVLPLLCFAPQHRELRTTTPVAGRDFTGRAAADAHCSAAFGPGWRMAEHHDGDWGLGARGTPPAPPTRFWVAIRDQPGNCWDSR